MRLADIAKELRITTQELRHELQKTNFGVGSAAHEVEDGLGKGILRYLKGKVKPTLTHKRVAVVFKDGKEEVKEVAPKKPRVLKKKVGKKESEGEKPVETHEVKTDEERAARAAIPGKGESPKSEIHARGEVPKAVPSAVSATPQISVNRRIEVATAQGKLEYFPKTFYKSKGRQKGKQVKSAEEQILNMMRHPHTGRKVKVARVSYEVGEPEGAVAEEIAIERELDREKFREQKKSRSTGQKRVTKAQPQIKPKTGVIEIPAIVSVKEFSEKAGLPVTDVIATLFKNGIMATINQMLDYDTAAVVASDLGMQVKIAEKVASSEDMLAGDLSALLKEEDQSLLKPRAPIVTVMGHVDHGKTKLLDTIRNTNVMGGEAGGITQRIGAYQVVKNGHPITFLDTPGHEAFTSMRARGAKVTDIAILVVAADEGVKPQTVEALNHAKEAGVPIIVAINKMDKPGANPDKVKGELVEYGLQSEDWGGKNIMVPISALKGDGVDKLLEMVLLVAEMENLKANPKRLAVGTVVEADLDPSLGPVATILVNTGTLRVGDMIVVGTTMGRVKTMKDDRGRNLKEVLPSGAARISGLGMVPRAGDILQSFKNEKTARMRLEKVIELKQRQEEDSGGTMVERIVSQISTGNTKYLKLVLKADTKGSLEAIMQALGKIKGHEVAVKVIHYGVGNISGTDIAMAAASQALVVGFNVEASNHIKSLADKDHLDIKQYTVIYRLIEDVTALLSGMLLPEVTLVELGKLEIVQIFLDKKIWVIAGCKVTEGKVEKGAMVRVKRNGQLLFETQLDSLKHVKEDVKELEQGSDCGIRIKTQKQVQVGDILEAYRIDRKQRTL